MLFEHVEKTDDGERVTERCRPAAGSKNEAALLVKANDDESGWRQVDETETAPQKKAQGRDGAAPVPTPTAQPRPPAGEKAGG